MANRGLIIDDGYVSFGAVQAICANGGRWDDGRGRAYVQFRSLYGGVTKEQCRPEEHPVRSEKDSGRDVHPWAQ
jgi:hypothetical protein